MHRVPRRSILALQVRDHVLQNVRRNPAPQRSRCISNLTFQFHYILSAPPSPSAFASFHLDDFDESQASSCG